MSWMIFFGCQVEMLGWTKSHQRTTGNGWWADAKHFSISFQFPSSHGGLTRIPSGFNSQETMMVNPLAIYLCYQPSTCTSTYEMFNFFQFCDVAKLVMIHKKIFTTLDITSWRIFFGCLVTFAVTFVSVTFTTHTHTHTHKTTGQTCASRYYTHFDSLPLIWSLQVHHEGE